MRMNKFGSAQPEGLNIPLSLASEGIIVADMHFKIIGIDRGAEAILSAFGYNTGADSTILPAEVREMLNSRPSVCDGSIGGVQLRIGAVDYTCSAFRVQSLNGAIPQSVYAIHVNRAASVSNSLDDVTEMYGLTDREREVMEGVSLGLTTKMLGDRMNISPNTVNAFLRMIMIKLGVTTRAGIVGKLLEVDREGNGGRLDRTRHAVDHV
jgi:DNA-binding CsgD family transcriptional regulator